MHQTIADQANNFEQSLSKPNGHETLSSEKERLNRDQPNRVDSNSPIKSEIKRPEKFSDESADLRTKNAEYADSDPSNAQKRNESRRHRKRSSVSSSISEDRVRNQKKKSKKRHRRHSSSRSSSEVSTKRASQRADRKKNSKHKVSNKDRKRKRSVSSSFSSSNGSRSSSSDFEKTLKNRKRKSEKVDERKTNSKRSKKRHSNSKHRKRSSSSDSSRSRRRSSRRSSSSSDLPSPIRSDSINRKRRDKKEIRNKYYQNIKTQENPLLLYKRTYAPVYQGILKRMRSKQASADMGRFPVGHQGKHDENSRP